MTIYVFFPVALFYYFNRPEYYRKTVEEKKVCCYLASYPDPTMWLDAFRINLDFLLLFFFFNIESALSRGQCKLQSQTD